MKRTGPLPALVGATVVATALCTLLLQGSWLLWVPMGAALVVAGGLLCRPPRR